MVDFTPPTPPKPTPPAKPGSGKTGGATTTSKVETGSQKLAPGQDRAWWQDLIDGITSGLRWNIGKEIERETQSKGYTEQFQQLVAQGMDPAEASKEILNRQLANTEKDNAAQTAAAQSNVAAPWEGRESKYAKQWFEAKGINTDWAKIPKVKIDAGNGKSVEIDWLLSGVNLLELGTDIAADPLTYVPGGAIAKPFILASGLLKGATRGAIQAARLQPSAKFVQLSPQIADISKGAGKIRADYKFAPAVPKPIKGAVPNLSKEATPLGAKAAANEASRAKWAYVTAPVQAGRSATQAVLQILGSSAEAGLKGTVTAWKESSLKNAVASANRFNARTVKKFSSESAKKRGLTMPQLSNVGPRAVVATNEAGVPVLEVGKKTAVLDELPTLEPVNVGGKIVVQDTDGVVYSFVDEAGAKAWIADTTNAAIGDVPNAVKFSGKMLADTAPSEIASNVTEAVLRATHPGSAEEAVARIDTANEIARKASGARTGGSAITEEIRKIIDPANVTRPLQFKAAVESDESIRGILVEGIERIDESDPFDAIRTLNQSKNQIWKAVASTIARAKIQIGNEVLEIQNLMVNEAGKPVVFATLEPSIQAKIIAIIKNLMAGKNPAQIEQELVAKLADLPGVGEDLASRIKATGALSATRKTDEGALQSILAELETVAGEVKFQNAAELINHVTYGGTRIDPTVLMKIAKALSPDAADWKKIAKALDKPENLQLIESILTSSDVRLTMKAVERRMQLLDADTFAQATNVAMPDVLAGQIDNLATGSHLTAETAPAPTRQMASESVAKWDADATKRSRLQSVLKFTADGLKGRFGFIFDTADNAEVVMKKSALGQAVIKRGDKAILVQDVTANFEVNFLGAAFREAGAVNARKVDKLVKAGERVEFNPQLLTDFIERHEMLEASLLSTAGVRISHAKSAERIAKGEKPFWAYVNTGDVAKVLRDTGNEELFGQMFYPYGLIDNVTRRSDWVSPIGLGKAITRLMEARQGGKAVKAEDLIADIKSMADTQLPRTKQYSKLLDEIAPKIADVLSDNIKYFEDAHAARVVAEVEDLRTPTQIFSYEILGTLLEAVELSAKRGTLTSSTYQRQALDLMNKFAIAADLFNQSSGPVAEAVMRSTATMFLKLTDMDKVLTLARRGILQESTEIGNEMKAISLVSFTRQSPEMLGHYENLKRAINTYFDWRDAGAELMAIAPRQRVQTVQRKLAAAEEAYVAHMRMFPDANTTIKDYKLWLKGYEKVRSALDEVRGMAVSIGVQTRHYDPRMIDGSPWVPAGSYDAAAAAKAIEDSPFGQTMLTAAKGDKRALPVDSIPKPRKLTPAQAKKVREDYKKNLFEHSAERASSQVEQAAETAMEQMEEVARMFPNDTIEQLYRTLYGYFSDPLHSARVEALFDDSFIDEFVFQGTTSGMRTAQKAVNPAPGAERVTTLERAAELASGTSQRGQVGNLANIWEAKIMRGVSDTSAFMDKFISRYLRGRSPEDLVSTIANAISKTPAEDIADPVLAKASAEMTRVLEAHKELLRNSKASPAMLAASFKNRGLDTYGLSSLDEMSNAELADKLFDMLPIGTRPADETMALEWDQLRKNFELQKKGKNGLDEFQLLTRVMDSIHFTAGAANMVHDLNARFGWKALGYKSAAEAKKVGGMVAVKQVGGKAFVLDDLIAEGDELILEPVIAKQFAATVRAWNGLFDKPSAAYVRRIMGVLSVFKALQTVVRPGHWVANTTGDTISAMIDGTNPRHLSLGAGIAAEFAGKQVKADFLGGNVGIEASLQRDLASISNIAEGLSEVKALTINEAAEAGVNGYKAVIGGEVRVIPKETFIRLLEDANILVKDNVVNDNVNFQHILEGMVGGAETTKMRNMAMKALDGQALTATVARGWAKVIKPFGDITAYLGNGIRAGHAIKTMESRSWGSMDELLTGLNEMANLWHPTVQSLSTFERRYVRQYFTYYTWLRGAHATLLEMLMNHTAAMTVPNKFFYNQSENNEMEPTSIGNLWGDKTATPAYLDQKAYGPTLNGPNGPMLYKPSVLPMDVADTWALGWDPTKSADANVIDNIKAVGRGIGSATNLLYQPIIEWIGNVNLKTGRESNVKDLPTLIDRVASDIGPMQLLQGLGLWAPSNKQPDDKYPITPREQEIKRFNYFGGMRIDDIADPASEYWGKMEAAEQKKRIEEMQKKGNK